MFSKGCAKLPCMTAFGLSQPADTSSRKNGVGDFIEMIDPFSSKHAI